MGAGASTAEGEIRTPTDDAVTKDFQQQKQQEVWSKYNSLPEKATEKDVVKALGDNLGRKLQRTFSIGGYIDKKNTTEMIRQSIENEVYNLFLNYTTNSVMNEDGFIAMLRDCRVLSKQDLSAHYARMVYRDLRKCYEGDVVNYAEFRNLLVPMVAQKKNTESDEIMMKFAQHEEFLHPDLYDKTKTHNAQAEKEKAGNIKEEDNPFEEPTQEQEKAVIVLQNLTRRQASQKKLQIKRQLSRCASTEVSLPVATFKDAETGEELSEKEVTAMLYKLFDNYSSYNHGSFHEKDQMDRYQFVHLCHDAKLISDDFSLFDCQLVFDQTIAMAINPSTGKEYNEGVFFNKRINFFVFRTILIPNLSNKVDLTTKELFDHLTAMPEKPSKFKEKDLEERTARRESAGRLFIDLNTLFQ